MPSTEEGQVLVDWVLHNDIVIAAPSRAVWVAVLDTNSWHGTTATSVSGPRGEVGERFDVVHPQAPETVSLRLLNVELAPRRRRTVRIELADGRFVGYASWILAPRGEDTHVTYDVFCLQSFPPEAVTEDLPEQASRHSQQGLENLKAFVESTAPA